MQKGNKDLLERAKEQAPEGLSRHPTILVSFLTS